MHLTVIAFADIIRFPLQILRLRLPGNALQNLKSTVAMKQASLHYLQGGEMGGLCVHFPHQRQIGRLL